jgi:hypothetical protein
LNSNNNTNQHNTSSLVGDGDGEAEEAIIRRNLELNEPTSPGE